MKSYNHLMEEYLSEENYRLAVRNATKHKGGKKRKYRKARFFRDHVDELMPELLDYAEHFRNEEHTPKEIYDGIRRKCRHIIVPSMREQVVHHMVVNVLKPIFLKGMYEHSYGSLPNRGATRGRGRKKGTRGGKETIEKWIRKDKKGMKYCLKMDIRKYFDSIPHEILKAKLAALIHDRAFLAILFEIVDAMPDGRGIPIGFYTSQWFANWYLSGLDHYIKEQLHARHYIRYMDDMVIFGGNKKELHRIRNEIERYLNEELGLEMKGNWQVFLFHYVRKNGKETGRFLDFMGFRFYRNRTTMRRSIMLKAARKAKRIGRKGRRKTIYDCKQMLSYLGWIDAADVYGMYRKRIKPYVNFQELRRRVGRYDRARAREMKAEENTRKSEEGKKKGGKKRNVETRGKQRLRKTGGAGYHQQPEGCVCAEEHHLCGGAHGRGSDLPGPL